MLNDIRDGITFPMSALAADVAATGGRGEVEALGVVTTTGDGVGSLGGGGATGDEVRARGEWGYKDLLDAGGAGPIGAVSSSSSDASGDGGSGIRCSSD